MARKLWPNTWRISRESPEQNVAQTGFPGTGSSHNDRDLDWSVFLFIHGENAIQGGSGMLLPGWHVPHGELFGEFEPAYFALFYRKLCAAILENRAFKLDQSQSYPCPVGFCLARYSTASLRSTGFTASDLERGNPSPPTSASLLTN